MALLRHVHRAQKARGILPIYGGKFIRARRALNCGSRRIGSNCHQTFGSWNIGSRSRSHFNIHGRADGVSPHCAKTPAYISAELSPSRAWQASNSRCASACRPSAW